MSCLPLKAELEARHAALLDDSVAFKKLAGTTDTATRMQLQAEIRRKVKSITFNFKGRMNLNPEWEAFPADEPKAVCWIEFINGAKRALAFTADRVGVFWVHDKDETPAGPPDAWRKNPA
jgi:hypothetical protein